MGPDGVFSETRLATQRHLCALTHSPTDSTDEMVLRGCSTLVLLVAAVGMLHAALIQKRAYDKLTVTPCKGALLSTLLSALLSTLYVCAYSELLSSSSKLDEDCPCSYL